MGMNPVVFISANAPDGIGLREISHSLQSQFMQEGSFVHSVTARASSARMIDGGCARTLILRE